jgi:hypothetical protein
MCSSCIIHSLTTNDPEVTSLTVCYADDKIDDVVKALRRNGTVVDLKIRLDTVQANMIMNALLQKTVRMLAHNKNIKFFTILGQEPVEDGEEINPDTLAENRETIFTMLAEEANSIVIEELDIRRGPTNDSARSEY